MTTRLRKLYERLVKKDNSTTNSENVDIDDSATVPVAGFFDTKVKLPTYQVIERRSRLTTKVKYVSLSLSDVLSTIREEADLARRVLFETARLQRPPFSIGPLKLSKDPYDVDIKLVELGGVLGQGYNLIPKEACFNDVEDFHDRRRKQDLALNGNDFKTTLGTAKKSLLDLEKDFNDNVLGELKKGMERKSDIEYQNLVKNICVMEKKFSTIYNKVEKTYKVELKAVSASQAQEGNGDDS